ncbi:hypothetical protein SLEP1_g6752 [Rubroshorea leprosula]|uniref:Uncharacterized protein n=1 Tax=Rubroshorea leprosula TaxID=152421 RepID=A0AAV5I661_9ROSI|nr:hypothetical protein SLEP1_g6752 [Rubroshorea leprosula]
MLGLCSSWLTLALVFELFSSFSTPALRARPLQLVFEPCSLCLSSAVRAAQKILPEFCIVLVSSATRAFELSSSQLMFLQFASHAPAISSSCCSRDFTTRWCPVPSELPSLTLPSAFSVIGTIAALLLSCLAVVLLPSWAALLLPSWSIALNFAAAKLGCSAAAKLGCSTAAELNCLTSAKLEHYFVAAELMEEFRRVIWQSGPPECFALQAVQEVIKPQKQIKLAWDEINCWRICFGHYSRNWHHQQFNQ